MYNAWVISNLGTIFNKLDWWTSFAFFFFLTGAKSDGSWIVIGFHTHPVQFGNPFWSDCNDFASARFGEKFPTLAESFLVMDSSHVLVTRGLIEKGIKGQAMDSAGYFQFSWCSTENAGIQVGPGKWKQTNFIHWNEFPVIPFVFPFKIRPTTCFSIFLGVCTLLSMSFKVFSLFYVELLQQIKLDLARHKTSECYCAEH